MITDNLPTALDLLRQPAEKAGLKCLKIDSKEHKRLLTVLNKCYHQVTFGLSDDTDEGVPSITLCTKSGDYFHFNNEWDYFEGDQKDKCWEGDFGRSVKDMKSISEFYIHLAAFLSNESNNED